MSVPGQHQTQSVFQALADPSRREILRLLRQGEMTAGDLAAHFDFSRASLSHHLNLLRQAELVRVRKDGQRRIYSLNTSLFEDLLGFVFRFIEEKKT